MICITIRRRIYIPPLADSWHLFLKQFIYLFNEIQKWRASQDACPKRDFVYILKLTLDPVVTLNLK